MFGLLGSILDYSGGCPGSRTNGGEICRLSATFRRLTRGPKAAIGGFLGSEAPPA